MLTLHNVQVVLIGVPGAFTPTCSLKHLPGFMEKGDDLKAKGVDTIACVAVNDAFVMDAWSKSLGTDGKILMLADGSAVFTKVCHSIFWLSRSHTHLLPLSTLRSLNPLSPCFLVVAVPLSHALYACDLCLATK